MCVVKSDACGNLPSLLTKSHLHIESAAFLYNRVWLQQKHHSYHKFIFWYLTLWLWYLVTLKIFKPKKKFYNFLVLFAAFHSWGITFKLWCIQDSILYSSWKIRIWSLSDSRRKTLKKMKVESLVRTTNAYKKASFFLKGHFPADKIFLWISIYLVCI